MTLPEFQLQMERLVDVWPKSYPRERVKLFWKELQDENIRWFTETVSRWIGFRKEAPLIPELQESLAIIREMNHERQKRQHEEQASEFWNSPTATSTEAKHFFETIKKRGQGKISDEEWIPFIQSLHSSAGGKSK